MFVVGFVARWLAHGKKLVEYRDWGSVRRLWHVTTRHVHLKENMERIAHHRGGWSDSSPTEGYVCQLVKPWLGLRAVALVRPSVAR